MANGKNDKEAKASFIVSAVDEATKTVRNINRRVEGMVAPVKAVNAAMGRLGRQMGLHRLGRAARRAFGAFRGLAHSMGGMLRMLPLFGGASMAGAIYGLDKIADMGDKIAKSAHIVGFAVKPYQEWMYVADRSRVPVDLLNSSLQAFSKRMGELRAGTGGLFTLLNKVNPAFMEQLKAAKSNQKAFSLLMVAISKLKNPQQRAALAAAAFSRAGLPMINIALSGADGMKKMRKEAEALGGVMDKKTTTAMEKFQDRMTDVHMVLKGITYQVAGAVIPVISDLMTQFKNWFIANKAIIKQRVAEYAQRIAQGIKDMVAWFKQAWPKITAVVNALGGLSGILKGVAAVMAFTFVGALANAAVAIGTTISAIYGLGAALVATIPGAAAAIGAATSAIYGLGAALMATPVGWILAAIAAIAGAVYLIYKNWDSITKWFTDKFKAVKEAFKGGFLQGIVTLIQEFNPFTMLLETLNGLIKAVTGFDLLGMLKGKLQAFEQWVGAMVKKVTDIIPDWMKNLVSTTGRGWRMIYHGARDAMGLGNGAGAAPAATVGNAGANVAVGGTVHVKIDSEGRPRVAQMNTDNPQVPLAVSLGNAELAGFW